MLVEKIKKLSLKYYPLIKELREHFHQYPELSFEEVKTAKKICEILDKYQISYTPQIAKTGIIAQIKGTKTSPKARCILLRADMDALPVEEVNDIAFCSLNKGIMHACGHDGHMAGLIGAILILNELKDEFSGTIKFMFQPAEENYGGAEPMIKEGALEGVDAVFACHLWGSTPEGQVQISKNAIMAGVDSFDLEFIGQGGHGAHPHTTKDTILMAARFVNNIQSIVSRRLKPIEAGVISIGHIKAGTTYNIIPQNAYLKGTVRYLNENTQKILYDGIIDTAKSIALEFGGDFKIDYKHEYPALINDDNMIDLATKAFAKLIGEANIIKDAGPDMGAEDFAFLARQRPGAYVFVGIKGTTQPLHHSPNFNFDSKNLELLMQGEAMVAIDFLND